MTTQAAESQLGAKLPGTRIHDWPLPDPKGQGADTVRAIRDEVDRRVRALVAAEGWATRQV